MSEIWLRLIDRENHSWLASVARAGLAALALPYGAVVRARNYGYDRGWIRTHKAAVPVVSVGNLTVGGTGKTPMVEWLARWFTDQGVKVVLLSRGYAAREGENDEARVLRANLPDVIHLQGRDRVALAKRAVDVHSAQVLILDDGFQHRRLARDLDILLVDATRPFGGGRLLPRGLLREPISSLGRAQVAIVTRIDHVSEAARANVLAALTAHNPSLTIVESRFAPISLWQAEPREEPSGSTNTNRDARTRPANAGYDNRGHAEGNTIPIESLRGTRVIGFCGIGNPDGFWSTLEAAGAILVDRRAFADHHWYSMADVAELEKCVAMNDVEQVVTTQKDLVKISATTLAGKPLRAIRIETRIETGIAALEGCLARIVPGLRHPGLGKHGGKG